MTRESRFLHHISAMLNDLIFCWQSRTTELLKVESAIMIMRKHCDRLKNELFKHPFTCDEDEIIFFKSIQPQFTGKLCYYTILYEALVSAPETDINLFWANERKRFQRFSKKHSSFIQYMESGSTYDDEMYFLRRTNRNAQQLHSKMYGLGADLFTLNDHLASAFLAEKMYFDYVKHKQESSFC
jgi:hypothetical protein